MDIKLYKSPDYRCLKPIPGRPSIRWPHYDMQQFREAKTEEELDEELLIHRSSSIYGPLHVRSSDLDVGAGSFNCAVQW